jgi:streptogramin lyase
MKRGLLGVFALVLVSASAWAAQAATRPVTEFPTSVESPQTITKGPDGNLWFEGSSGLGKITPAGAVTPITGVPNVVADATDDIASGPDGDIWFSTFTSGQGDGVGKINPTTLAYNEYSIGVSGAVRGIVAGPDGRMWFAVDSEFEPKIGAITTSGTVSLYSTGFGEQDSPIGLAVGADGNIWFVTRSTYGKVTTGGAATVFTTHLSGSPSAIAAGPDGNLWFTESDDVVTKLTNGGATFTEYPVGPAQADNGPSAIVAGPDGNLWFSSGAPLQGDYDNAAERVGKMTTSGVVTDYLSTAGISSLSQPSGITAGPDGNIWFTEETGGTGRTGAIGRLDLHAATPTPSPTPTPTPAAAHTASIVVRVIGKGSVVGSGFKCPGACSKTFSGSQPTTVALHANAAAGYHLAAWSGGVCQSADWKLLLTAKQYGTCTLSRIHWDGEVAAWNWGSDYTPSGLPRRSNLALNITAKFVKGR